MGILDIPILIAKFCPLIQLLAGLYLILIYEGFFQISPIKEANKSLKPVILEYFHNYQGEREYFIDSINKREENENKLHVSFRKIYGLFLCYNVFLLCYSGLENWFIENDYLIGLISVELFVLIYTIFLFFYRKKCFLTENWMIITCFILCFVIFFLFNFLSNVLIGDRIFLNNIISIVSVSSLLISFSGLILIFIIFLKGIIWGQRLASVIYEISEYTEYFIEKYIIKTNTDENKKLDNKIQRDIGAYYVYNGDVNQPINLEEFLKTTVATRIKAFL